LSSEALITEFILTAPLNTKPVNTKPISPISNEINQDTKIITIVFPSNTRINSLTPTIKISEKATISDADMPKDFTKTVTYTVTAEDGTIEKYTINVTIAGPTDREVLIKIYNNTPEADRPDWDLNAADINTWDGVTVINERVSSLQFESLVITIWNNFLYKPLF